MRIALLLIVTDDIFNWNQVPEGGELLQDGTVRINVWASPRSLSTALMYSFAQVRRANQALVVGSAL